VHDTRSIFSWSHFSTTEAIFFWVLFPEFVKYRIFCMEGRNRHYSWPFVSSLLFPVRNSFPSQLVSSPMLWKHRNVFQPARNDNDGYRAFTGFLGTSDTLTVQTLHVPSYTTCLQVYAVFLRKCFLKNCNIWNPFHQHLAQFQVFWSTDYLFSSCRFGEATRLALMSYKCFRRCSLILTL
jgi:hypothetical protein